tara:strand:+ start:158 stop:631 length:474 start_codon:yes stop_codon:yes gene_type:complete
MSEESKESRLQSYCTYNYSDTVKGIECSTVYIHALQNIITKMITKDEETASTVYDTFTKFNKIVEANSEFVNPETTEERKEEIKKTAIKLDEWESDLYTLYSLLQQMKYRAKEQGLEIKQETDVTKEEIEQISELMMKGENVLGKLDKLQSKLKVVK